MTLEEDIVIEGDKNDEWILYYSILSVSTSILLNLVDLLLSSSLRRFIAAANSLHITDRGNYCIPNVYVEKWTIYTGQGLTASHTHRTTFSLRCTPKLTSWFRSGREYATDSVFVGIRLVKDSLASPRLFVPDNPRTQRRRGFSTSHRACDSVGRRPVSEGRGVFGRREPETRHGQGSPGPAVSYVGEMPFHHARGSVPVERGAQIDEAIDARHIDVVHGAEI